MKRRLLVPGILLVLMSILFYPSVVFAQSIYAGLKRGG
jgi:hypothetical protein